MEDQDTPKKAPEKGTLDLDLLAKELDVDKKLLENSLTGDETQEEALKKLAKKSANAQREMSKTKQEKADLEKQLEDFAKETTKKAVETEEETEVKKEPETVEVQKTTEETSKIKEDMEKLRKELGIVQGEVAKTKTESRQMREEQVNQVRKQKIKNGFNWLMTTFGDERAYELFNPINPKESPVGRILHPDTNKNAELYLAEDDPVKLATVKYLTDMGLSEDMTKALKSPASLTETPGGNVPSEKGKEQAVEKLGKMIFGK